MSAPDDHDLDPNRAAGPGATGGSGFKDIYREQYRQVSTSRTSQVFRFVGPVIAIAVVLLSRHNAVLQIVFGALAVLLFVGGIVLSRRQRR